MIFYHGTTVKSAEQIMREGLKPNRKASYDILNVFGIPLRKAKGEDEPVVYLTRDKQRAEHYAQFRTRYEQASKGQALVFENSGYEPVTFWKRAQQADPTATPAVLTIDIPEHIYEELREDVQDYLHNSKVYEGIVPSQYIQNVEVLR